jgi:diadenosine tetraphosphate (Ap4A) HIT family hydrolase
MQAPVGVSRPAALGHEFWNTKEQAQPAPQIAMIDPASSPAWSLHPHLARDTAPAGDLTLCRVLAMNDSTYPWVLLVPRQADAVEIIDLDETQRTQLMAEIAQVAHALKRISGCDKLNVAAIGNMVPQLHVHVVARRIGDPAWPKPVWGAAPPQPYPAGALGAFVAALRLAVGID